MVNDLKLLVFSNSNLSQKKEKNEVVSSKNIDGQVNYQNFIKMTQLIMLFKVVPNGYDQMEEMETKMDEFVRQESREIIVSEQAKSKDGGRFTPI